VPPPAPAAPAPGAPPAPAPAAPAVAAFALRDLNSFRFQALGPGVKGKNIYLKVVASSTQKVDNTVNPAVLKSVGVRIQVAYWQNVGDIFDVFTDSSTWPKTAVPPDLMEDFDDVVIGDETDSNYILKVFGSADAPNSALVSVALRAGQVKPYSLGPAAGAALTGGADGPAPVVADYTGIPNNALEEAQGLEALKANEFRDVSLVYAPNVDKNVAGAIITHCEKQRYRFAVIDSAPNVANSGNLDPRLLMATDTQYAAFYYPWLWTSDPQPGALRKVPPGGHVLGVYARTDDVRGVFKAPANEIVEGAIDLEFDIHDELQAVLNPKGVNVIRKFPSRGVRIWGARTLTSNTLWKYVPVRRLFIFLERSIFEGTQWVVFEPNDETLWARVKDTIRLFLRSQWRQGALMGVTEDQAFQIACDRTTMTQDDILNGRLIAQIGIAPVRPAEFVIFQIYQNTAEAQV
jgi:phage tail sheath protein FI